MILYFRECESDFEKGSASTSLMKAIIGPGYQQAQKRVTTPISNVNSSMANMALVGNNVMTSLTSGNLFGINDHTSDDILSQFGWDTQVSDTSTSANGNANVNMSTSFSNNLSSQLKISQQLQRSLSTSTAQRQTQVMNNNNNNVGGVGNKRSGHLLGQLGQRSSSLDLGQGHGQGVGQMPHPQGQKSPGYSQSPSPMSRFQIPPQRSAMMYNRRSPVASPVPNMSQGSFNAPFPPRTPSPMLSPSPGKIKDSFLSLGVS